MANSSYPECPSLPDVALNFDGIEHGILTKKGKTFYPGCAVKRDIFPQQSRVLFDVIIYATGFTGVIHFVRSPVDGIAHQVQYCVRVKGFNGALTLDTGLTGYYGPTIPDTLNFSMLTGTSHVKLDDVAHHGCSTYVPTPTYRRPRSS